MSKMQCDECGCRSIIQRTVRGHVFVECEICGTQIGNDEFLEEIEFDFWAERNKIEPEVQPLVRALNLIEGFETYSSCGGHPSEGMPPYVYFKAAPEAQRSVARLVELIEMLCRRTSCRWILEVTAREGLSYWLRPLFPVISRRATESEVKSAREDVSLIAGEIMRHSRLSWWCRGD